MTTVKNVLEEVIALPYLPWIAGVLLLLLLWLAYRVFGRRKSKLSQILDTISFDRVRDLVLPNGDDGEILIDRLLLTSQGLLILEIKEVQGTVFGSNKMQDWTVIASPRRYTFPNPQPGLYDRLAAVREVVRQIPVEGRILFLDGAEFPKGVPDLVVTLDELARDFGEQNSKSAQAKIDAFMPHWQAVKKGMLTASSE
ncbi:MAG TPA: nuclease-related domain-containing protein [Woeseiaceae bacterium]|nr:nuclease-related domain-containing protein [Woeseiaceae bacterium]